MKRLVHHLAQLLPALLSLALLAWVLRSADASRALTLVRSLGWRLPLLLLPNLAAVLAEAAGWWASFSRLGARPRFHQLLGVRVVVDALMLGLPSGTVVSNARLATARPMPSSRLVSQTTISGTSSCRAMSVPW